MVADNEELLPFEDMLVRELTKLQKRVGNVISNQSEILTELNNLKEENIRLKRMLIRQEPNGFADCLEKIVLQEFELPVENIEVFHKCLSSKRTDNETVIACRSLLFYVLTQNFDWTIPMIEKRYGYKGRNFAVYIEENFLTKDSNGTIYTDVVNAAYATCDAPARMAFAEGEDDGFFLVPDEN